MIDYVFRYAPGQGRRQPPADADEARRVLIEGNQVFSQWMRRCRAGDVPQRHPQYVVPCGGLESAVRQAGDDVPTQEPFAVVLGCSDARVPTEMLFGQGFNDLFVLRVAGNVVGDAVQGTLDFALAALSGTIRVLVTLGHTNCGAVKGAVESYLDPDRFWAEANTPALRLIFQRILVAVRQSDNALREVWGEAVVQAPGYRQALNDTAVCLNAAQTAFTLRQQVDRGGPAGVQVLFGVCDVRSHQVCMPLNPPIGAPGGGVNLATAPEHPEAFADLARQVARRLQPDLSPTSEPVPGPHVAV